MVILLGITVDSLREVNMEVAKHERESKGVAAGAGRSKRSGRRRLSNGGVRQEQVCAEKFAVAGHCQGLTPAVHAF
jgi:hypothetical protein